MMERELTPKRKMYKEKLVNPSDIAKRIKILAKNKGVSIKKMLEDVGLGSNTMGNMKTSVPQADNLLKIANYFDCSVDYLLGKNPSTQTTPLNERLEVEKIKITYADGSEKEVTRGVCFSVYDEGENMFVSCDGVAGNNMDCAAVLAIIARIARELGIDEEL